MKHTSLLYLIVKPRAVERDKVFLLFCQTGELTVQTKRWREKKMNPPKYKYFIGMITSILPRRLWQVKEPPKETKCFPSWNVLFYPNFFSYCFQSSYHTKKKPKTRETHHTFLDIDFVHVFAWSVLMALLFPIPVDEHLVSKQRDTLSKAHPNQGATQSISQMTGPEATWQGDTAYVAQDKFCAYRPQLFSLQQQCTSKVNCLIFSSCSTLFCIAE